MADMTLEEALEAATVDEELISPVNEVLMIDPETRTINVPDSEKMFGARQDMGVERKYFKCPRIVGDNIDLSEHRIFVNYVPSKQDGTYNPKDDVQGYWCKDLAVEGDFITFSWEISENVTRNAGYIAFAVYAKTIDEYGNLKTKWHTTIAIGNVLDTLLDGEEWITVYPDIVMQLLERMDEVEKNGGNGTSDAIQYIEQALTEEQQTQARTNIGAASAKEVSKLLEEKVSNPSTGEVGQILEIESVDENGKPKTYKAVNKPTGGEVSDEQIVEVVENYLTENPIKVDLSDYAKKNELPTVPTKVSAFENDKGYLTEHQSLEGYAKTSDIPTDYAKENHTHSEYLTEHQDISGKQDKLVSGENIKTVNGKSLLGSGDITIEGGSSGGETLVAKETVLASGTMPNGSAQWVKHDTGLTIGDLRKYKIFGFVLVSPNDNNFALFIGSTKLNNTVSKKRQTIFEWLDSEKTVLRTYCNVGSGYIDMNRSIIANDLGVIDATMHIFLESVTESDEKTVKFYSHNELTYDVQWKICGVIEG